MTARLEFQDGSVVEGLVGLAPDRGWGYVEVAGGQVLLFEIKTLRRASFPVG